MQVTNEINNSIADELEDIALVFSMLEKNNLGQSLTTIEGGLNRIDDISQETDATALRALGHWMALNLELNEDTENQIKALLQNNSFSEWVDVLAALLREYDQSLLPQLHQSLATPDWPIKPSAPLLKSIANWLEETRLLQEEKASKNSAEADNAENSSSDKDDLIDNDEEFEQKHVFEEIDVSILNKNYDDCTEEVLKEIKEHPDFKVSLIETDKTDIHDEQFNDDGTLKVDSADDNEQIFESTVIDANDHEQDNPFDDSLDFTTEVDEIVISLSNISASTEDVLANIELYNKELNRLTELAEISSYEEISNISDWCQRNIELFAQNQTDTTTLFVSCCECWTWIELIIACIAEPDEQSHLSNLAAELNRQEWLEPLDEEVLQALLLSLKKTTENDHIAEEKQESKIVLDLDVDEFKQEQTDVEIPYIEIPELQELNIAESDVDNSNPPISDIDYKTSDLQLNWDDDTHPELLTVYLEETPTQISQLNPILINISQKLSNKDEKHTASRMAHTIKGGSAVVGVTALSEFAYRLETILDYSVKHELSEEILSLLPEAANCLDNLFDALQTQQVEPQGFLPLFTKLTNYVGTLDEEDDGLLELSNPELPDFIVNQNTENQDLIDAIEHAAEPQDLVETEAETKVENEPETTQQHLDDVSVPNTESATLKKLESTEEINDITVEIDDIVMTLASISTSSDDVYTQLDDYSAELQRFSILTEISGYPQLSSISQWCQDNLTLFAENKSDITTNFIQSGECWTWLELIVVCLTDEDELSHLSSLTSELTREEWKKPLDQEDLQNLLLALRKSDNNEELITDSAIDELVEADELAEPDSNDNSDTDEHQEVDVAVTDIDTQQDIISWDEDIHPELLATYFQETPDQIIELAEILHKIADGKAKNEDHKKAARIAHTIKGSSGVVGITSLVDLTHKLEDILDFSVNNKLPSETSDLLAEASDSLESLFETIQNKQDQPEELVSVLTRLGEFTDTIEPENSISDYDSEIDEDTPEFPDSIKQQSETFPETAMLNAFNANSVDTNLDVSGSHIRVPVMVIDKLLNLAGELVTTSTKVSDQINQTLSTSKQIQTQDTRVHKMLDELSETIFQQEKDQQKMLSSLQDSDFDSLEMDTYNELHSVAGLLTESILDSEEIESNLKNQLDNLNEELRSLGKLNKELSEVILSSRMVSINTLVPRLERIVRQTCRKTDKKAELNVTGNDIFIDTDIVNGLVDPLLHLLRNAVDHGIETTAVRKKKKKGKTGKIDLNFSREGNNILMQLKDDGAGIDPELIYQQAIDKGIITPEQEFSTSETLKLILQPGFSTQENISDISGRGVGMDVVNSAIENLKGTLQISSDIDQGTTFNIKIPLTLVTNTTLLVKAAGNPVAIPSDNIEQLLYLSPEDVVEHDGIYFVKHQDTELQIQSLADLLGWPTDTVDFKQSHTLLLIKGENQTHAVHIEEIIYSREVVVKSLNPWVNPARGVVGACHLNDGGVAPVLNLLPALSEVAKDTKNKKLKKPVDINETVEEATTQQILVVDDSLSNRKALSLIIDTTDYEVITAVDGLDALKVMNENPVDMVFTDLEMPRMNGLELTQAIRAWNDKKHLPVVMITSRTTSKHRELAKKAGVNAYLTKPVVTETLLESIESWLKQTETSE